MTRTELYSLVWELPLVHLARRLGISNARLKKICEDFEVPVPPAGYWAKRAAGQVVERPPLPNATPSIFRKLNSALRRIGEIPLKIADHQIDEFDIRPFADRLGQAAPSPLPVAHPCVVRLSHVLSVAAVDDDGFVASGDPALPNVRVSPALIDRTTLLVAGLIEALQRRHHHVHDGGPFRMNLADEIFELKVYETRQRIGGRSPVVASDETMQRRFRPSGKLCMEIADPREFQWSTRNLVGQWHDRRDNPLELSFDRAIDAMETAAEQIRYYRTRAQEQAQLTRNEAEALRVAAAKAERAGREVEFLTRNAATYTRLQELKQFAAFLIAAGSASEDETVARMLRQTSALIDKLEQELTPDQLAAEARRLDLFNND